MKRKIFYLLIALPLLGMLAVPLILGFGRAKHSITANPVAPTETALALVAGPGRVEPISEEIKVGAPLNGKLKTMEVEEGTRVQRGEIVAVLENDDYRAQVALAEAQLRAAEADQRRIINGARRQERRASQAGVEEASAVIKNARLEMERQQALFRTGDVSREQVDRAEREYETAHARYQAMVQRHALVDGHAREEDQAKAAATVEQARARLSEARAQLNKTFIRSPITGVILKKHIKVGETVADSPEMPVFTVADLGILRVRMDVDESDIGKIRVGQRAYVTAYAYGDKKFYGHVTRIGQVLGLKNIRTDKPTERVDTKVLETLVDLEDGHELHPGLPVDAFIVVSDAPTSVGANRN